MRRFSILPFVALFAAAGGLAPSAQGSGQPDPRPRFHAAVTTSVVELTVSVMDESGRPVEGLTREEIVVLEDGRPRPVLDVEPLTTAPPTADEAPAQGTPAAAGPAARWRVVVWFDAVLSSTESIRSVASRLAEGAADLTELGEVEVVLADSSGVRVLLPATGDRAAVAARLRGVAAEAKGQAALVRFREQFVLDDVHPGLAANKMADGDMLMKTRIRAALSEESRLVSRTQDRLLAWLAGNEPASGPRALFLVSDGFDADPREWYFDNLRRNTSQVRAREELKSFAAMTSPEERARVLATAGWRVFSFAPGHMAQFTRGASVTGEGKVTEFLSTPSGLSNDGPALLLDDALAPLRSLAEATGGGVETTPAQIAGTVGSLRTAFRVAYQSAGSATRHRVEVRCTRPGTKVAAPQWSGSASSDAVSSARARLLLDGGAPGGDLPVACAVQSVRVESKHEKSGVAASVVDLSAIAALAPQLTATPVRVTTAVDTPGEAPFIQNEVHPRVDLSKLRQLRYDAPLRFSNRATTVALVFEELTSGAWGGCTMKLP